jgi:hypothetical protein
MPRKYLALISLRYRSRYCSNLLRNTRNEVNLIRSFRVLMLISTPSSVDHFSGLALIKTDARDFRQHLDPHRGRTPADNAVFHQEKPGRQIRSIEAELLERGYHSLGVLGMARNPDIKVVGRSRVAVIADRIAANQEIFNAMGIEQSQEPFEVMRQPRVHN